MLNNVLQLNAARQSQKIKLLQDELAATQQENEDLKVILGAFVEVSKRTYFGHVPSIRALVDKFRDFQEVKNGH